MTFKEIEKQLSDDGWILKSCVGSHFHYIHPNKSGKVTVPNHKGDIPKGTVNSILKQAGLK
ncbi:MAG: type II toxin-antitoxin system HicA family toxin [Oscillospiraceae bacterium]|nr:type II toxin-antitoxin system HicA family toxin [Oscillospiraceae bacterium]